MSSKRVRRHYPAEKKAEILRRHMVDKVPISDLCNELSLQPSVFYQWQRQAHENLATALEKPAPGPSPRVSSPKTLAGADPETLAGRPRLRLARVSGCWRVLRGGPSGDRCHDPFEDPSLA
jgi:transposase-like protein